MIVEEPADSPQFYSSNEALPIAPLGQIVEADKDQATTTARNIAFPQKLLNVGFCMALILAGVCLITSAFYLNTFLNSTNQGIQELITKASSTGSTIHPETLDVAIFARLTMARMALLSCGVFIGMSFGFLGFALFLMGIRDEMKVSGRSESYYVKLAKLSPGVFVILCATILVGICVTRSTQLSYYNKSAPDDSRTTNQHKEEPESPGRTHPLN